MEKINDVFNYLNKLDFTDKVDDEYYEISGCLKKQ